MFYFIFAAVIALSFYDGTTLQIKTSGHVLRTRLMLPTTIVYRVHKFRRNDKTKEKR